MYRTAKKACQSPSSDRNGGDFSTPRMAKIWYRRRGFGACMLAMTNDQTLRDFTVSLEKQLGVGYNVDPRPSFSVENLANGVATRRVAVRAREYLTDVGGTVGEGSRHFLGSIAPGNAVLLRKGKTGTKGHLTKG